MLRLASSFTPIENLLITERRGHVYPAWKLLDLVLYFTLKEYIKRGSLMVDKSKKQCQICGGMFEAKDLYPIAFIRENVLDTALQHYPKLDRKGVICFPDLRKISAMRFEKVLKDDRGALSRLEKELLESLQKQEIITDNINEEFEERLTFGERIADDVAKFGGSWTFIIIFAVILVGWVIFNSMVIMDNPFDAYPYILLNLVLSCLAALQAPVIMMSQNRQAAKDRLDQENDYLTNLKSELEIRQINGRLDLFMKHHWQTMQEVIKRQKKILTELEDLKEK